MLQLQLSISVVAVVLATGSCVAGVFGMNLVSGLEDHPTMFHDVVVGTSAMGFVGVVSTSYYMSLSHLKKQAISDYNKVRHVDEALNDMGSVSLFSSYFRFNHLSSCFSPVCLLPAYIYTHS